MLGTCGERGQAPLSTRTCGGMIEMPLTELQIAEVLSLSFTDRFGYFIKRAAENGVIYGLSTDGWAVGTDANGRKIMLLWPDPEFAALCATGEWAGYVVKPINLAVFMDEMAPALEAEKVLPGIFPMPITLNSTIVNYKDLIASLKYLLPEKN